jgi:hypothetical protein
MIVWGLFPSRGRFIAFFPMSEVLRNPVSLRNRVSGVCFIQLKTAISIYSQASQAICLPAPHTMPALRVGVGRAQGESAILAAGLSKYYTGSYNICLTAPTCLQQSTSAARSRGQLSGKQKL